MENFEKDQSDHIWKLKNPKTRKSNELIDKISPTEAILNWQSENAIRQNSLKRINESQHRIEKTLKQQAATLTSTTEAFKQRMETVHNKGMTLLA